MTLYEFFKFLHVCFAIAWIGGGFVLMLLGVRARRRGDAAGMMTVVRQVASLATLLFIPASAGALISGIIMLLIVPQWGSAWVLLGLAGFAATFTLGNFFIRPRADRLAALDGTDPAAIAAGDEILQISRFDYVLLFAVVADMVIRPMWSDWIVIVVLLAIIGAAAWLLLVPVLRRTAPPVVSA